jgi:hypothetical protein
MSDEIILTGFGQFKSKLLPAVLVDHKSNSNILGAWLVSNGININTLATPEEVADALYRATSATYEKLSWSVKPAKLTKFVENEKVRSDRTALADQAAFAEKSKQAEAENEKQSRREAAFRRIDAAIAAFQLKDTSGTRIMHGRTGLAQDKARKFVQKQIEAKADMEVTERAVRKYLADLYEEDERSREHA